MAHDVGGGGRSNEQIARAYAVHARDIEAALVAPFRTPEGEPAEVTRLFAREYRTVHFVRSEVESIALQLRAMQGKLS